MLKKRKLKAIAFGATLAGLVLVSGCQEEVQPKASATDETKVVSSKLDAIESVLQLQFTGPDPKMLDLMWVEEKQVLVDGKLTNPEFNEYFTEQYGEYFTTEALDTFVRTFGTTYHNLADSEGYTMSLGEMVLEQNDNENNRYVFTATVNFEKEDGTAMVKDIEGIALFSTAEKKIGKFEYTSDDGLTIPLQ